MKDILVFQQPKTIAEIDLGSRFQQLVFLAKLGFRNDGSGRSFGEARGETNAEDLNRSTKLYIVKFRH